jgi:hypothetical protein
LLAGNRAAIKRAAVLQYYRNTESSVNLLRFANSGTALAQLPHVIPQ